MDRCVAHWYATLFVGELRISSDSAVYIFRQQCLCFLELKYLAAEPRNLHKCCSISKGKHIDELRMPLLVDVEIHESKGNISLAYVRSGNMPPDKALVNVCLTILRLAIRGRAGIENELAFNRVAVGNHMLLECTSLTSPTKRCQPY